MHVEISCNEGEGQDEKAGNQRIAQPVVIITDCLHEIEGYENRSFLALWEKVC